MNKKILFLGVILSGALYSLQAQTDKLYWNFNTGSSTTVSPTSGTFTGLTVGSVTQGNNHGTSPIFTATSASTAYTTAAGFANSGGTNAGAAAFIGTLATSTSTYFGVTLSLDPTAGSAYTIGDVSLGSRSTSTGPQLLSLYGSTDGFSTVFTLLGTATVSANSTWAASDFSGLAISLPDDSSTYSLRLYGSNGSGTTTPGSVNWRIDDLTVELTPAAVPEPGTIALASLGGLACLFAIRRRK